MDEKKLQELQGLKKDLTSLVISSAAKMDVRSLSRDYRDLMGCSIPFYSFGYKNLINMLQERCSDVFLFSGPSENPVLTPIITDSIKHIDKLVTSQKNDVKRRGGKRSSVLKESPKGNRQRSNPSAPSTSRQANYTPAKNTWFSAEKAHSRYQNQNHSPAQTQSGRHSTQNDRHTPPRDTHTPNQTQNDRHTPHQTQCQTQTSDTHSTQAASNNKYSAPLEMDPQIRIRLSRLRAGSSDGRGYKELAIETSPMSKKDKLRDELRDLIADHPSGIWSTELQMMYQIKYKIRLEYQKYGYDCIMTMCYDMDVFRIQRPRPYGDWLLKDIRRPESPVQTAHFDTSDYEKVSYRTEEHIQYTAEDALPGIPYEPSVLPPDCVNFMDNIPLPDLSHLVPGAKLEVCVAEVGDPSHFWFQLQGEAYRDALELLMDELENYYSFGEGADRKLDLGAIMEDQYVAALFQGNWHRAVIVQILDKEYVKVRHIDYGTVDRVRADSLRYLLKSLSELPVQAIRGRLAYLKPAWNAVKWTLPASTKFLELIKQKSLFAYICDIDEDEQIYSIVLVDTTTDEDIYIREELQAHGLAEIINEIDVEDSVVPAYYFPTFETLEAGRALNFAEKHIVGDVDLYPNYTNVSVNPQPRTEPKRTVIKTKSEETINIINEKGEENYSDGPSSSNCGSNLKLMKYSSTSDLSHPAIKPKRISYVPNIFHEGSEEEGSGDGENTNEAVLIDLNEPEDNPGALKSNMKEDMPIYLDTIPIFERTQNDCVRSSHLLASILKIGKAREDNLNIGVRNVNNCNNVPTALPESSALNGSRTQVDKFSDTKQSEQSSPTFPYSNELFYSSKPQNIDSRAQVDKLFDAKQSQQSSRHTLPYSTPGQLLFCPPKSQGTDSRAPVDKFTDAKHSQQSSPSTLTYSNSGQPLFYPPISVQPNSMTRPSYQSPPPPRNIHFSPEQHNKGTAPTSYPSLTYQNCPVPTPTILNPQHVNEQSQMLRQSRQMLPVQPINSSSASNYSLSVEAPEFIPRSVLTELEVQAFNSLYVIDSNSAMKYIDAKMKLNWDTPNQSNTPHLTNPPGVAVQPLVIVQPPPGGLPAQVVRPPTAVRRTIRPPPGFEHSTQNYRQ